MDQHLQKYLDSVRDEADQLILRLAQLKNAAEKYPDLTRHVDRWKKEYFCSARVNGVAERYLSYHGCGCCADSPLMVSPFVEEACGLKVFSNPYYVTIGQKSTTAYGDELYVDWRERLRNIGCTEALIEKVGREAVVAKESTEE